MATPESKLVLPSQADCSRTPIFLSVNKKIRLRLDEIAMIENLPLNTLMEKLILNYTPVPAPEIPGEFKTVYAPYIRRLKKLKPYVIAISVLWNSKIGMPYKIRKELKEGKITIQEFTRKYIERLMLPDAQEEIARLRKLKETQDIYITCFNVNEEGSMRKIFVDFVNGKIVWK